MKKIRIISHHLSINLVSAILVITILFAVSCKSKVDEKEQYVRSLVAYLKSNSVDSTTLAQPFFNEKFRSNGNPFNSYVIGLEQMKEHLQGHDPVVIKRDESNSDTYILMTSQADDKDRIFFLVKSDGIESFSPLFKGKEIVGWM